jgi:hypothetical protein
MNGLFSVGEDTRRLKPRDGPDRGPISFVAANGFGIFLAREIAGREGTRRNPHHPRETLENDHG